MSPLLIVVAIAGLIWLITKLVGQSKGQVRCNDCGHIGILVPAKHSQDVIGAVKQKLVCSKCGSSNWTPMQEIQTQIEEKQRIDNVAQDRIESRPHCQQCGGRVEHEHAFCPNCGSKEIVKHEDWLLSSDRFERQKIMIGREIAKFRSMARGMKYCPSCSTFMQDNLSFCPKCGTELVAINNEYLEQKYGALYPEVIRSQQDLIDVEQLATGIS